MTRFCDRDDLSPTAFSVFGTLDNTRKIENLDFGTIIKDLAGNSCEL